MEPYVQEDWKPELPNAIQDGRIFPAFQPIVSLNSYEIMGFEVLARWQDPYLGTISPAQFLPEIERLGLLDQMLDNLIQDSFSASRSWPTKLFLAFNVSPTQLRGTGLVKIISDTATRFDFPLSRIQIEITETSILEETAAATAITQQLSKMGLTIALDDFGTGYSSLTWMQAFPFSELKIDVSFVRSMLEKRQDRKIVDTIVGLGQNLGLQVVAEGIETEEQADYLRRLGCPLGQGFLFARPLPASEVPALLLRSETRAPGTALPILSPDRRVSQLAALYRSSAIGIAFLDTELRFLNASEAFAHHLRYPAERLIGRKITDILDLFPKDLLSGISLNQTPLVFEADTPDGGTYLMTVQRIFDEADEFLGVSVVSIDITGRKSTEIKLRASEEHYRNMVELSLGMLWTATPSGEFIDVSPNTPAMKQVDSIDDLQDFKWLDYVHPDHKAAAASAWRHALLTGENYDIELLLLMPDGSYRWHRAYAAPRKDDDGNILLWYGTSHDIEERKQLEIVLRGTSDQNAFPVEVGPRAFYVTDNQGRFLYANDRARRIFGLPATDLINSSVTIHPADVAAVLTQWETATAAKQAYSCSYRIGTGASGWRDITTYVVPRRDGVGSVACWYGVVDET